MFRNIPRIVLAADAGVQCLWPARMYRLGVDEQMASGEFDRLDKSGDFRSHLRLFSVPRRENAYRRARACQTVLSRNYTIVLCTIELLIIDLGQVA